MKILLFGKNGQVGRELQRSLAPLGQLIALDRAGTDQLCGDLSDLIGIKNTIQTVKPDVIVNAAAYTAVDKSETERCLASMINAKAPEVLALEALNVGALLIHYSSDYVFDGSGDISWFETDQPSPLNYYGVTKWEGEQAIQASGCHHFIFRTSWVYGVWGSNFIKTVLRLASEKDQLHIVSDQIGAPTGADLIADISALAITLFKSRPDTTGLYHLAPQGEISWYDYAQFILDSARKHGTPIQTKAILPIPSTDFVTPAKRPYNSKLNTTKLCEMFSLTLPSWEVGVAKVIKEVQGLL